MTARPPSGWNRSAMNNTRPDYWNQVGSTGPRSCSSLSYGSLLYEMVTGRRGSGVTGSPIGPGNKNHDRPLPRRATCVAETSTPEHFTQFEPSELFTGKCLKWNEVRLLSGAHPDTRPQAPKLLVLWHRLHFLMPFGGTAARVRRSWKPSGQPAAAWKPLRESGQKQSLAKMEGDHAAAYDQSQSF